MLRHDGCDRESDAREATPGRRGPRAQSAAGAGARLGEPVSAGAPAGGAAAGTTVYTCTDYSSGLDVPRERLREVHGDELTAERVSVREVQVHHLHAVHQDVGLIGTVLVSCLNIGTRAWMVLLQASDARTSSKSLMKHQISSCCSRQRVLAVSAST